VASGIPADVEPVAGAAPVEQPQARECMHCAASLTPNAKFCTECELFQRHFMRSKSSVGYITLLNALFASVLVVIMFVIDKLPETDLMANSDPVAVGFTCYRDQALLGVTNRGRRTVTIEGGTVTATGLGGPPQTRQLRINHRDAIIGKGASQVVGMTFFSPELGEASDFDPPDRSSGVPCNYRFSIRYQDFRTGTLRNLDLGDAAQCDCAQDQFLPENQPQPAAADKGE
jgi:hypothetical protein